MTTTAGTDSDTQGRPAPALDRRTFVSQLVSGGLLLLVPAAFGAWPLSLIGGVYVAAASLFLAAVYARGALTRRQEVLTWVAPWLGAAVLWTGLLAGVDSGASARPDVLWVGLAGLVIATPCYLVWQLAALAVRQVLASRSTTVSSSRP